MNSWDCFDTLIARRFFYPKTIFDVVGQQLNDPDFKSKRIAAEKSSNKTYQDIYARLPNIDPQIELDVELEHSFPIMENMSKVQDGDLILSDMYLSKEFVEKLLRKCGLTKKVDIIVTPDGKKKGWIWKSIKEKYKIDAHYGDNQKSDVISANLHGINGIYTGAFDFSNTERLVYTHDKQLACWMRYIRLQNPYTSNHHTQLWNDQANINLPVLALATLELPDTPIAFTYRDCYNWHKIYQAMTGKKGYKLDVSRKLYLEPNENFNNYMSFVKENGCTIVDLQGKGKSILTYYKGNPPRTVYIGGKTPDYIEQLVPYNTKSMEKHNCYKEGPIIDWTNNGPVRDVNDHPIEVAEIHEKAGDIASASVVNFKFKRNRDLLLRLVKLYDTNNYTNKHVTWAKYN